MVTVIINVLFIIDARKRLQQASFEDLGKSLVIVLFRISN